MPTLFEALVRHQLYLEGLKADQSVKFTRVALAIEQEIKRLLARVGSQTLDEIPYTLYKTIERQMKASMISTLNKYDVELYEFLKAFVVVERSLFVDLFSTLTTAPIGKLKQARPAADIYAEAMVATLGANGVKPTDFIKQARASAVQQVVNEFKRSRVNGDTKEQFSEKVLGTKANSYRDGTLQKVVNQTKAVTNTVVQHLSINTNSEVASQAFPEYEWVSVLDDKTTEICRSRDGKRYPYGKGPLPPAHVNCRSSCMPVDADAGAVDYLDTLTKWAKATPETILKDIFKDGEVNPKKVKPVDLDAYKSKKDNIIKKDE